MAQVQHDQAVHRGKASGPFGSHQTIVFCSLSALVSSLGTVFVMNTLRKKKQPRLKVRTQVPVFGKLRRDSRSCWPAESDPPRIIQDLEDSALEPRTPEKIQVKAAYHGPPKPTHSEDIALYKKLAWTKLRLKELESAVTTAVSEKVAAHVLLNEVNCGVEHKHAHFNAHSVLQRAETSQTSDATAAWAVSFAMVQFNFEKSNADCLLCGLIMACLYIDCAAS